MMTAVVLGANGQDGTFLVRHLLGRGYEVVGIGRRVKSRSKIDSPSFLYRQADLRQESKLAEELNYFKPDFIFHVAAVHTSAGGSYEAVFNDMLQINVATVHTVLEYLRGSRKSRFIYASSKKVFGEPVPLFINEDTPKKSQCLYSISKNAAYDLIEYYRAEYGVEASVVYLFNHESEHRPDDFFIPIILKCLSSALSDNGYVGAVNTLDFYCDWGSAEEYMDLMIDMVEKAPEEDFVLARGDSTYARDLIEYLFNNYRLDYRKHIQEKHSPQLALQAPYTVDLTKLKHYIHRTPNISIYDLCKQILERKYSL